MSHNLIWAISASLIVSAISLVGIVSLLFKERLLNNILVVLIGFAAGSMIGSAFLHLLPELIEDSPVHSSLNVFAAVVGGFILFFFLERYFYWRHCHQEDCKVHSFTYLNLIGDGIHNFTDGIIIGTSFAARIDLGVVTTMAIVFHEIPQEISEFGVLVYGGLSKGKALLYNFASGLTAFLGTLIGFHFASQSSLFTNIIIPIAAGGFIYIAACDLVPEIHKESDNIKAILSIGAFLAGILLMYFVRASHSPHL